MSKPSTCVLHLILFGLLKDYTPVIPYVGSSQSVICKPLVPETRNPVLSLLLLSSSHQQLVNGTELKPRHHLEASFSITSISNLSLTPVNSSIKTRHPTSPHHLQSKSLLLLPELIIVIVTEQVSLFLFISHIIHSPYNSQNDLLLYSQNTDTFASLLWSTPSPFHLLDFVLVFSAWNACLLAPQMIGTFSFFPSQLQYLTQRDFS